MGNHTLGTDPFTAADSPDGLSPHPGLDTPGPKGVTPMKAGDRIVTKVSKNWVPLVLETTPEIVVNGKTLADVADDLNTHDEWGQGGGGIPMGPSVAVGTSTSVAIELEGKFIRILPTWRQYGSASAAAKAEWDRMVATLTLHEDRHVAIAVEEADKLAANLIGKEIGQIASMINATGRRIQQRQVDLDTDTANGTKPGVKYGGVMLDTSVR